MNLLFICSRNIWRSRTAETIFKKDKRFQVKSAGTAKSARIRVNRSQIDWAHKIFVMEKRHRERLEELFGNALESKELIVLDIPDEYKYMDEDLVENLKDSVEYFLSV